MRIFIGLMVGLLFTACADSVTSADLGYLDGYWEIEKVVFPDGNSKSYGINTTIDYFEYGNRRGFRKKVQPRLDGIFITSDDAESFEIVEINSNFMLVYENELSRWEEEIRSLSADKMVLVSNDGLKYHYKRFEGIISE